MDHRRRRIWLVISIILLILVAQFAFFEPVRDLARRIVSGPIAVIGSANSKVRNSINLLRSIGGLIEENNNLRVQNTKLLARVAELTNVKSENEQLRKDLAFSRSRPDLELLPVSIINYSPIGSYQALTIDRGSDDGVLENQAVVSGGFLVGKVKNVSKTTAEVWLLTNRNLLTPVILTNSQVTGILKGGIRGLVVDNIPIDTKTEKGELIVTSALEGLYPSGLAVGQIEEVISKKEEIFIEIRISSPINIANIRTLFIVK